MSIKRSYSKTFCHKCRESYVYAFEKCKCTNFTKEILADFLEYFVKDIPEDLYPRKKLIEVSKCLRNPEYEDKEGVLKFLDYFKISFLSTDLAPAFARYIKKMDLPRYNEILSGEDFIKHIEVDKFVKPAKKM